MTERKQCVRPDDVERHVVQFYKDEATLIDQIWNFISPALFAGDAVIIIATKPRLDQFERKLARYHWSSGITADARERYVTLDAEQTLAKITVDGQLNEQRFHGVVGDAVAQALGSNRTQIRAYGEMVALLCAEQKEDTAIRLERFWNTLTKRYPLSLLCAYPIGAFSSDELGEPFKHICDAHTQVRPAMRYPAQDSDADLQRTIATLQQKAAALESEVARRKKIEKALHLREQELSDFLENALEGMHRVGPDGTILWANKAELKLLGYTRVEYLGHNIAEFHVDRDIIDNILRRLLMGDTLYDHPARMRHKDGSIRHVLIHSNAQVVEGEFISTRCLTRDVTDRVLLEEELKHKLNQLADIDRRKDEFLAMLGHELRNPLAPIKTSLELMRQRDHDLPLISRTRETIERQVAMMIRLVDDLLDVSRITRGKIDLKREPTTLGYIVERAVEIAMPLIDAHSHDLMLSLPPEPLHLYADPSRLAQVLANLLHNAAKYTDAGGHISLDARTEGNNLQISIIDNGIGLDPELLDKAFDLFVQGNASLANTRGGLGIGLTLVRSLVHLHGGEIKACSEGSGHGSEFIVTLPLYSTETGIRDSTLTVADNTGNAISRNILIVDDNIDAAESLGEFLKISGHHVDIAHDGRSAIDQANRFRPDIVILDIGMPAMDGYQVAHCMRLQVGLTSSMLIAVTGYAQERDRLSAREAGFDYHFAKPIDIDRLTNLINRAGSNEKMGEEKRSGD